MKRLVLLSVVLCASCERAPKPAPSTSGAATALDAALAEAGPVSAVDAGPSAEFVGSVRGVVRLAPGQTLPIAAPILVNGAAPISAAPCPPVDLNDRKTVRESESTKGLSPVHIAITGMSSVPPHTATTREVFIDACRARPTLVGAVHDDKLRVVNRSQLALLPTLPGDRFMQAILPGESREVTLKGLGTQTIGCSFSNYCGESAVITLSHALQAVSDEDGRFSIEQIPLDQELTLHAWHPLFDVASVAFKLTHAEREKGFELALTPLPGAATIEPKDAKKKAPKPARKPAPHSE